MKSKSSWWKRLWCRHNWGGIEDYPNYWDEGVDITTGDLWQISKCRKCGKWSEV